MLEFRKQIQTDERQHDMQIKLYARYHKGQKLRRLLYTQGAVLASRKKLLCAHRLVELRTDHVCYIAILQL